MNYKVTLGSAENGKELVWSVRTNPHAYLSGKSGSGKSYKLRELIAQLPGQGIRCVVCDCSNDLSFASPQRRILDEPAGVNAAHRRGVGKRR